MVGCNPASNSMFWRYMMAAAVVTVELKSDGTVVGMLVANAKVFSTGSQGFFGTGKLQIGEKKYQCQVQMVEIGSKPKQPAKK
jgi:hypothetical protein